MATEYAAQLEQAQAGLTQLLQVEGTSPRAAVLKQLATVEAAASSDLVQQTITLGAYATELTGTYADVLAAETIKPPLTATERRQIEAKIGTMAVIERAAENEGVPGQTDLSQTETGKAKPSGNPRGKKR